MNKQPTQLQQITLLDNINDACTLFAKHHIRFNGKHFTLSSLEKLSVIFSIRSVKVFLDDRLAVLLPFDSEVLQNLGFHQLLVPQSADVQELDSNFEYQGTILNFGEDKQLSFSLVPKKHYFPSEIDLESIIVQLFDAILNANKRYSTTE